MSPSAVPIDERAVARRARTAAGRAVAADVDEGRGREEPDGRDDRDQPPGIGRIGKRSGDDAHGKPPFRGAPGRSLPSPRRGLEHVVEVVGELGRRELVHELGEPSFDPVEGGHASCPPATDDVEVVRVAVDRRPHGGERPVMPGLGGPDRDPERRRHVGQRHPEVVVQDDDRALLGLRGAGAPVEQVAIGDDRGEVGDRPVRRPATARPRSAGGRDVAGRRCRSGRRGCGARPRSDPDREASAGSARLG